MYDRYHESVDGLDGARDRARDDHACIYAVVSDEHARYFPGRVAAFLNGWGNNHRRHWRRGVDIIYALPAGYHAAESLEGHVASAPKA